MYALHYHEGPKDGTVANSFRPYDAIWDDETVYEAKAEGEACLVWLDDWTRRIDLYWLPGVTGKQYKHDRV